jgi:16S rRNA (cytosine967-C5)-methyltransferase
MPAPESRVQDPVLAIWRKVGEGAYLAEATSDVFRRARGLDAASRRAVVRSVRDLIGRRRLLDHLLEGLSEDARQSDAVRFGVSELVAGRMGRERLTQLFPGVPWGVLEKWEALVAEVQDPIERLGLRYSLPLWAARSIVESAGDEAEALAASLDRPAPRILRVNTLKADRDTVRARLAAEGLEASPTTWSHDGLVLEPFADVFHTATFHDHLFEVQDESSQLCVEAVAPPPHGRVLDACAGSGSKTLAIAALLRGRGRILAIDIHEKKISDLKRRARQAGAYQVMIHGTTSDDWTDQTRAFARRAHRILLDVPCSGLGVFRRRPDMRWRITEDDLSNLEALQRTLLARAARDLAPKARLIYATCTLRREENEDQVAWALDTLPGLELVRLTEIWGTARARPITDPTGTYLKLFPHRHGTDGFFTAVLRRTFHPAAEDAPPVTAIPSTPGSPLDAGD